MKNVFLGHFTAALGMTLMEIPLQQASPEVPAPLLPPGGGRSGSDGGPEAAELLDRALLHSQRCLFVSWLSLLRSLDLF